MRSLSHTRGEARRGSLALASAMIVVGFGVAQAQTPTTTTLASSPNPSVAGQAVTFTATVTPAVGSPSPVGTVTFFDGTNQIGTATLISNGTVSTAVTAAGLAVGSHTITASYPGNTDSGPSSGSTTQTVNKNDTTTQIGSSVNPSAATQSVTFTAVISPVTPTAGGFEPSGGTITFFDGGTPIGTGTLLGNGQAVFSTSNLAIGNHTITTSYTGDDNFNGSNGSLTGNPQVVNKGATTLTLTSSLNPSTTGQSVTFTATISPTAFGTTATPTGTVTFFVGTNPAFSTAALVPSGTGAQVTFTTSFAFAGNFTITASYSGDGNFSGSNGSLNSNPQVVNQPAAVNTSLTIAHNPNGTVFGQPVTFMVTITAASGTTSPTGTVTFSDGFGTIGTATATLGPGTAQSTATLTTSALPAGNLTITADYGGDSNFNPSTISTPFTVGKGNETTSITTTTPSIVFGQSVTFVITVTANAPAAGTPTGTVSVRAGATPLTLTLSGGQASFTTSTLPVGEIPIIASYNGDNNFTSSSAASFTEQVTAVGTTMTLTSSANPSTFGQSVTFTATILPSTSSPSTPSGQVLFFDGTTQIGSGTLSPSGANGVATFTTANLAVGNHNINVSYAGDTNFAGGTAVLTNGQTVGKAATTTTPVTFTATVAGERENRPAR